MELRWENGSPTVRWDAGGHEVVKEHPRPIRSVAYVPDPPSVVIIEEIPDGTPSAKPTHNAVVYELDGAERVRLAPPRPPTGWQYEGFDQCFHDTHGVVAVYRQGGEPVWAYANVQTGQLGPLNPFR